MLGNLWKPLGDVKDLRANVLASGLIVAGWGYFLIQGVRDPLGGINSLWPLFGIANQLLAAVALCLATTVILKMTLQSGPGRTPVPRSPAFALVTLVPLLWLLTVTMTAGWQKIFSADPGIGFIAQARVQAEGIARAHTQVVLAKDEAGLRAAEKLMKAAVRLCFNNYLDAVVAAAFLVLVALIVSISVREWILLLARKRLATLRESDPVWLPDYAMAEGKPLRLFSLIALAFALSKELSGEAALERAQRSATLCDCGPTRHQKINLPGEQRSSSPPTREQLYLQTVEQRFNGINRCC